MKIKDIIKNVKDYKKAYKNYIMILYQLNRKRNISSFDDNIKINVTLRNGEDLVVPYGFVTAYVRLRSIANPNISDLKLTNEGIAFRYKDHPIILDTGRFSDPDAVFFNEEYKFLNVNDMDVVDIGMNIGDSSIYFSINGAKRVIELEPYPYAFSSAEKNVKLNNVKNIILINAGYGKDSNITVSEKISSNSSSLISSDNGKEISIMSLKTLINRYNIDNDVLKMDCEGCEYSLMDEEDEVFTHVKMIQIEYHYGYKNLVKKLKDAGFDVKYTEPRKSYNPDAENPNMEVGYIYEKRIA
jgi:FkbM family methyltransferase